jgi:DNA helicase-2/ATP-dependent DNA helicase PcrA
MLGRVEQLLGRKPEGLWGGTFHSVANRLLRQHATRLGYTSDFGILDADDAVRLIAEIIKELALPKEAYIPKKNVIASILSFAKNSQKSIQRVVEDSYGYILPEAVPYLDRISESYERRKRQANVMDFDDLLTNWLALLLQDAQQGQRIASQFSFVLVDEFQDTNVVQARLIQELAKPQNNLVVVGDDAQSIYSFRAATIENILSFQQVYPQAKVFKLEMNYRSTEPILALANASIRQNQFQYEKQLQSGRSAPGARQEKPVLIPAKDAQQQAEIIAQRVMELQREGDSLQNMAILFRSSSQIIELELEMNRRGIPYLVRGGLRFFEQAHIKDVLAYLHIFQNPKHDLSWRRVLGLYEGIGPATSMRIYQNMRHEETLSGMLDHLSRVGGKAGVSAARVQQLFLRLMAMPAARIGDLIREILEQGYQVQLERTFDDARDRLEDLHQLALFAANYASLREFLSEASLSEGFRGERSMASAAEPEDRIVLSTIHQAKGLEWDTVFAIGLAEGQFPHYRVLEKPKEMEEERRLFYVTVTRPRKRLYLLYPIMSRSYAMGDKINRPSLFLREIDETLYEEWQVERTIQPAVALKRSTTDRQYIADADQASEDEGGSIFDLLRGI